jgi:hypothetical protein
VGCVYMCICVWKVWKVGARSQCPLKPTFMSSTLMVLSSEQLSRYLKEGWKTTQRTQFSCAGKVIRQTPLYGSHNFTDRSLEPEAR